MGWEFNLRLQDIEVPTHCPILGIELRRNDRIGPGPASPSLDRIDSTKGYIRGNVRVISFRANALKSNATAEEHEAIARYMRAHGVP
jgi:hypothetical protein